MSDEDATRMSGVSTRMPGGCYEQTSPVEFKLKWQPRPSCIAVLRNRCVYMTCVVGRAVCLGYIKVNIIKLQFSAERSHACRVMVRVIRRTLRHTVHAERLAENVNLLVIP